MNLRAYYQKVRDIEDTLVEAFVVLISHETPDGGKAGLFTEVPKQVAAKMIADGRASVASEEKAREFQEKKLEAKRVADQEAVASKMQLTVVPTADIRRLTRSGKE